MLSPVYFTMSPLIDGLTDGPRLPRLLMSARPPAAAPADRYSLVNAKNSGVADAIPITANDKASSEPPRLPCSRVVTNRPIAAMQTQAT